MATDTEHAAEHAAAVAREAVARGLVSQANATRAYQEYAGYLQKGVRGTLTQLLLARKLIDQAGFQLLSQGVPAQFMAQLSQSGTHRVPTPSLHNSGFALKNPMAAPPRPSAALPPRPNAGPPPRPHTGPPPRPHAGLPPQPHAGLPPQPHAGLPPQPAAPRYDPDEDATITDGQVIAPPEEPSAEMTMVDMAIPVLRPPGAPEVDDFNPELTGEMAQPVGYVPPVGAPRADSDLAPIPLPPGGKKAEPDAPPVDRALLEAQERAKASKFATKSGRQKPQPEIVSKDHEASKTLSPTVSEPRSVKGPLALAVVALLSLGLFYFVGGEEQTQSRTARRSNRPTASDPGEDLGPEVDPDDPEGPSVGDSTPDDQDPEGMTGEAKRPSFITPAPEPGTVPKWLAKPEAGSAAAAASEATLSVDAVGRFDDYERAVRDAVRRNKFVQAVAAKDQFLTPDMLSQAKVHQGVTKLRADIQSRYQAYKVAQTKAFDQLLRERRYTQAWALVQGTKPWALEDSVARFWRKQFVKERNGFTAAVKKLKGKSCKGKLVEAQLQKHLKGWGEGTARVYDNGGVVLSYEGASDLLARDFGVPGVSGDGWLVKPLGELVLIYPLPMARVLDVSVELVLEKQPEPGAEIVVFAGLDPRKKKKGARLAFGVTNGRVPVQILPPQKLERLTEEKVKWPPVGVPFRVTLHVNDRGIFKGSVETLRGQQKPAMGTPFRIKDQVSSAGRVGVLFRGVEVTIRSFDLRGVLNSEQVLRVPKRGKPKRTRKRSKGKRASKSKTQNPKKSPQKSR